MWGEAGEEMKTEEVKDSRGARSRCSRIRYAFNVKFMIGNLKCFFFFEFCFLFLVEDISKQK